MKQVIFLCLLSVTLCLSKPAETQAPAAEANGKPLMVDKANNTTTTRNLTEAQTAPKAVVESTPITNLNNTQAANKTGETTSTTNSSSQSTNDTKTPEKHEEASVQENEAKKNETATTNTPKGTIANTQASNETKPENNDTKPDEKKKKNNGTATQPIEPEKPTSPSVAPKTTDDKLVVQARGFDGPSFMGGIILTLGLLAIGFMGFKYYKNQTERNYHTL